MWYNSYDMDKRKGIRRSRLCHTQTPPKQAFADALRKLLEQKPFAKISVSHICEECGMNRKSFYYHFKDKYDLVNWIFDTEITKIFQKRMEKCRLYMGYTGKNL